MQAKHATVMAGAGGEAYVQWVRRAVARAMHSHEDAGMLFGSSVEEPVELLRQTVESGFKDPITSRYTSVFVAGNPYVLEQLESAYGMPVESILPTTGATGALSLLYRAYLAPGDHVLVESPGFDLFEDIAKALRASRWSAIRGADGRRMARRSLYSTAAVRATRPGWRTADEPPRVPAVAGGYWFEQ
jgi:histidinol-phosphate/aromatic aminotransferase/cobyric acid decarboxylase-like protein